MKRWFRPGSVPSQWDRASRECGARPRLLRQRRSGNPMALAAVSLDAVITLRQGRNVFHVLRRVTR